MEYNIRRSDTIPEATGAEIKMGKILIFNGKNLKWGSSESLRGKDATALHKSITLQPTAFLQSGDFFQAKVTDAAIKDGATIHSSCDLSSLDAWQEAQGVSASLDASVGFFYVVCKKKPSKSLTIKYTIV